MWVFSTQFGQELGAIRHPALGQARGAAPDVRRERRMDPAVLLEGRVEWQQFLLRAEMRLGAGQDGLQDPFLDLGPLSGIHRADQVVDQCEEGRRFCSSTMWTPTLKESSH